MADIYVIFLDFFSLVEKKKKIPESGGGLERKSGKEKKSTFF